MTRDEGMAPPPAGTTSAGVIGDKPINAKSDYATAKDTIEICCVLTGDWPGSSAVVRERCADLGAHYVQTLYQMVSRFAPANTPWRFTCFTDRLSIVGVPTRPIPTGVSGYFSKLYCFSSEAYPDGARVLYFDLDTVLVGPWAGLATVPIDEHFLWALRDRWCGLLGSGIMTWRAGPKIDYMYGLYRHTRWQSLPATDEDFIRQFTDKNDWGRLQDAVPGQLASYKFDITRSMRGTGQVREQMTAEEYKALRVIYFHGLPRPHQVLHSWNPFTAGIIDAL